MGGLRRRRPEQTLWYRIVQAHFATWLDLSGGPAGESPPAYVERSFRRYLECGILAHGFARAWCDTCQHEFLIAYFLSGTQTTLPVFFWSQLRFPARLPVVLALGALILLASVALVVLAEILRNRGVAPGKKMIGA